MNTIERNPITDAITFWGNYAAFKSIFDSQFNKLAQEIAVERDPKRRKELVLKLQLVNSAFEDIYYANQAVVKEAVAETDKSELQEEVINAYNNSGQSEIIN